MIGFEVRVFNKLKDRWPDGKFLDLSWHMGELRFESPNNPGTYLHHYLAQSQDWFGGYIYDNIGIDPRISDKPTDFNGNYINFPVAIFYKKP